MQSKVIIITGAGSGIGRSCARIYASKGFAVVINGRNLQKLEEVAAEIRDAGGTVLALAGDVSVEEDCRNLVEETIKAFGRIDILLNNAGISMRALFEDTRLEVIHRLMNTNFWGTVYCTHYALPYLLASKGSIIGVSSIAGKKGLPGRTGYSSSKFAMEGFLETLRTENLKKGLHVLVACPGFTATGIRSSSLAADGSAQGESPRDESKMMSSDQVARAIYQAVERRKRDLILTFNGKLTVFLDKFFPGFMDKLVYNHMAKEPGSPFQ